MRGEGRGDGQLWRSGQGAIVVCYGWGVGGVDVVPLQGAIVVCYGWGGWGSGRGAIAGCHCSVLWLGGG